MTAGLGSGLLLLAALAVSRTAGGAIGRTRTLARLPRPTADREGREASRFQPPSWLVSRIESADLALDAGAALAGWSGAVALSALAGLAVGGPALAVVAAVLVAGAPALVLGAVGGRADRRLEAALPEALESVARALRGGASLQGALGEAGDATPGRLGDELCDVVASTGAGVSLAAALDQWAERRPLPAVRLGVAALALAAETGGASARAVDGVAETIRGRLAVGAEVRALSAQARLSALVIVLAPLAFSALAVASDDGTSTFLFRSPAGLACLVVGLGLDAVAAIWMQRLSRVDA